MSAVVSALVPNSWIAITPSDSTVVNVECVYVGSTGAVAVTTQQGDSVTFAAVPTGTTLIGQFTKVMSTNTTATSLLGGIRKGL